MARAHSVERAGRWVGSFSLLGAVGAVGVVGVVGAVGALGVDEHAELKGAAVGVEGLHRTLDEVAEHAAAQRVAAVWAGQGAGEGSGDDAPRGFGRMTARVPGTERVISGVRLVSHHVSATVRDGFARTTIEEEFQNDTGQVLEGRYVFPLPPDASISRLALYVGDELIEGEIVERPQAARIFKGIVDDTVRPRDPALLEWVSASEFSLKIFPIPARGKRKVVLAYDQALTSETRGSRGEVRYVYPLALGADRATGIDDFSIKVKVAERGGLSDVASPGYAASLRGDDEGSLVQFAAQGFTPTADFVVSYRKAPDAEEAPVAYAPSSAPARRRGPGKGSHAGPAAATARHGNQAHAAPATSAQADDDAGAPGYFALRLRAELPEGMQAPEARRDRAIVIDVSHSQSTETVEEEARLATGIVRSLRPGERFVVLACDSDCAAWPEDGLGVAGSAEAVAVEGWLRARVPQGSSDLAGSILAAARRLAPDGAGQVVVIGDGAVSSGELSGPRIAARVAPVLRQQGVELRFLGLGRSVDEVMLGGLSRALGATYERVSTGAPLRTRGPEVVASLRAPVIQDPQLTLPEGMSEVYPRQLPNLRVGQEVVVTGRVAAKSAAGVTLRGTLAGAPYTRELRVSWPEGKAGHNPLVPRLWAKAKISELERETSAGAGMEALVLAKEHHVMTRGAAMLVLESERMFAEFGIGRTAKRAVDLVEDPFAARGHGRLGGSSGGNAAGEPSSASTKTPMEPQRKDASPSGGTVGDPWEAQGNLWGERAEAQEGPALSGTGRGGGGTGDGAIGLGKVGVIGHGAGTSAGTGSGFGSGASGRLGGSHRMPSPRLRAGETTVNGRLPPEVIQRIVRQNFGRFRLCYDAGLQRNPELEGRVTVRFAINAEGSAVGVGDGGSSLPDATVVGCVVQAFRGLSFPSPEGGVVMVTYPIQFNPPREPERSGLTWEPSLQTVAPRYEPVRPSAVHRPPTGAGSVAEATLASLREGVEREGASRQKHAALVRQLLVAGRVEEALTAATRFARMDPDLEIARELLAGAAAASGRAALALTAMDALSVGGPREMKHHLRAAKAFEAAGEERRACAHWRALGELRPSSDEHMYEALRCRARALGEVAEVLAEARAMEGSGANVRGLIAALEAGRAPGFDAAGGGRGPFMAKVVCSGEPSACPWVAVVTPSGAVVSPWTPGPGRASRGEIALSHLMNGTFRVIAAGGKSGSGAQVELLTLGASRSFAVEGVEAHTVAMTTVSGLGW
ncbi:VIT domain-containing protein [Chondromyces crocatus]|uniref:VIT domain-containing protein n=1 Tax=Chondromyces crocatus TaxID=52 RepID=A0A0K1E8K6_CHOCO|nr:VIT domain-containing protein [Chondromyces crocatus]AKT37184.1 uncharacterized protein CMC5_013140 [Chondromyces crocatus]